MAACRLTWTRLKLPKGARVFAPQGARGFNGERGHPRWGCGRDGAPGAALRGHHVSALIDGETTLKRYVVQRGKPFLKAENPAYEDLIPAQELVIQGVQIALLRVAEITRRGDAKKMHPHEIPSSCGAPPSVAAVHPVQNARQLELPLRI